MQSKKQLKQNLKFIKNRLKQCKAERQELIIYVLVDKILNYLSVVGTSITCASGVGAGSNPGQPTM